MVDKRRQPRGDRPRGKVQLRTIKQEFMEFAMMAIPADAGPAQFQDMQDSFYAGVTVAMEFLAKVARDDVPDAEGMAAMDGWAMELRAFRAAVMLRAAARAVRDQRQHNGE
jgi:hypothetical protein